MKYYLITYCYSDLIRDGEGVALLCDIDSYKRYLYTLRTGDVIFRRFPSAHIRYDHRTEQHALYILPMFRALKCRTT